MRKFGFSKNSRMTERHQFVSLFDNPHVFKTSTTQLFWKQTELKKSRLGITIKGKLSSVWRTRLKRRVREWFRLNKENIHAKHGTIDLNVVLRIPKSITWLYIDTAQRHLEKWL